MGALRCLSCCTVSNASGLGIRTEKGCDRLVMIWCGSTEIYQEPGPEHASTHTVTVHYGKTITVDVVMEERYKYIEEKVMMKLFESFGLG